MESGFNSDGEPIDYYSPPRLTELSEREVYNLAVNVGCENFARTANKLFGLKKDAPDDVMIPEAAYLIYAIYRSGECPNLSIYEPVLNAASDGVGVSYARQADAPTGLDSYVASVTPDLYRLRTTTLGCGSGAVFSRRYFSALIDFYALRYDEALSCLNSGATEQDAVLEGLRQNMIARVTFWKNRFSFGSYMPEVNPPTHNMQGYMGLNDGWGVERIEAKVPTLQCSNIDFRYNLEKIQGGGRDHACIYTITSRKNVTPEAVLRADKKDYDSLELIYSQLTKLATVSPANVKSYMDTLAGEVNNAVN